MSRLLAWLTSLVLLALVAEGVTRLLTTATPLEPDATLGWRYRKGVAATRTVDGAPWELRANGDRLRAPEGHGAGARAPGEFRLLLLGDSFTLGWGLPPDQTFASRLEARLAAEGRPATVIPAGTEGWSTDQECRWLETRGAAHHPDAVIVLPYANDVVWNARPRYLSYAKPMFPIGADGAVAGEPAPVEPPPFWTRSSRLVSKVQSLRMAFASRIAVPSDLGGGHLQLDDFPFLRREAPEAAEGWRATAAVAKRIVEKARAIGAAKVYAAPIPTRFEIHPGDGVEFIDRNRVQPGALDFGAPTKRLGETFAAAGASVLDAAAAVRDAATRERLYFEGADWHFNARGAAVFADGLHDALAKADGLPPSAPPRSAASTLASAADPPAKGLPTWVYVVGALWVALSLGFKAAYPDESFAGAAAKVGALLAFVVAIVAGVTAGAAAVPPAVKVLLFVALFGAFVVYAIVKTRPRFGTIRELFGALVDRGHWYLVPMLVVMLTISVLLVVAQNPIVAPFIYTLF